MVVDEPTKDFSRTHKVDLCRSSPSDVEVDLSPMLEVRWQWPPSGDGVEVELEPESPGDLHDGREAWVAVGR